MRYNLKNRCDHLRRLFHQHKLHDHLDKLASNQLQGDVQPISTVGITAAILLGKQMKCATEKFEAKKSQEYVAPASNVVRS